MIEVRFKKLHKDAVLPERATQLAGGWDVVATEIEKVSDDFYICHLGFALQPPFDYKVALVPRSSITKTKWVLQNSPGLGDPDYLHEYQLRFRAIPEEIRSEYKYIDSEDHNHFMMYPEFPYKAGDRVGQIYLEKIIPTKFIVVDELVATSRMGGFGSTGVK